MRIITNIVSITNGQESGEQQVTVTIVDDDEPPVPDISFTVDRPTIPEAAGIATLTVSLSKATTVPVTVDLGMTGSATALTDFVASATQVVITPGATTSAVTITAVQDELDELDETVVVDITSVVGGRELGEQQQTVTIVDNDLPPSFAVTVFETTKSGFRAEFANDLDATALNLYATQDAGLGAGDVVLTGAAAGPILGSLVVGSASVEFIKTGGPLAPDTYTVTLRSAPDGFKDSGGMLLDGDANGTGGDDYTHTFTVAELQDAKTVSIPDFVRGPGQVVKLPADGTTGIPISISEGDNVRAADIRISYDPALLQITGAIAPAKRCPSWRHDGGRSSRRR